MVSEQWVLQRSVLRATLLINDLDEPLKECTFSKPVTDTKLGAGVKYWRARLQLRGTWAGWRNKLRGMP